MAEDYDIAGVVLAGGRSRRFGSDKRFFELGGKTLFDIACTKVRSVGASLYVAADEAFLREAQFPEEARCVVDVREGQGPLMGVYSALHAIEERACLVVPVDMPFLEPALLRHLVRLARGRDIVVSRPERPLPLPGVYGKRLLPLMEEALGRGDNSLVSLIGAAEARHGIDVAYVGAEDLVLFGNPSLMLRNLNTPEDVADLE